MPSISPTLYKLRQRFSPPSAANNKERLPFPNCQSTNWDDQGNFHTLTPIPIPHYGLLPRAISEPIESVDRSRTAGHPGKLRVIWWNRGGEAGMLGPSQSG